ncbi:hypothetical protein [Aeromonas veronii]|uniref:hypothetical protein n=1 Tax=Aeromonas veronii TaxID=654 RepID=UPI002F40707D
MDSNKINRSIRHLISDNIHEQYILDCLNNVEIYFGSEWINSSERHKIQTLWKRKDELSTSELFIIGNAIEILKIDYDVWLKKTIGDIKKQPDAAHGYFTEMIFASSIKAKNAKTIPAPANKPGYDVLLESENKKVFFSVKNHDISKHHSEFLKYSDNIRNTFKNIINRLGVSGRLVIIFNNPMSKSMYKKCILTMQLKINGFGVFNTDDGLISIQVRPYNEYAGKPTILGSDLCIIIAPYHRNEHIGFIRKLEYAGENMKKHLKTDNNSIRMLYMRLHHTANLEYLIKIADRMISNDEDCGFDCVILAQPTVARDLDGYSSINTFIKFSAPRQDLSVFNVVESLGHIDFTFPLGTISQSPAKMKLINVENGEIQTELNDAYIYQRGDIKVFAEKKDDGSYFGIASSPASGVHVIPHFNVDGQIFSLNAVKPEFENLLLI